MIKKSVDDAILDAILAKAFEEAATRDLAELETNADACPAYPEEFRKIERRRYNKVKRSSALYHRGTGFIHTAKRVVSFVLIIGFVSFCVMLSAPTIRAEFVGMITKFFDKCFTLTLPSNVTSYETENYIFGYIPNSYTVTDSYETFFKSIYLFTSSKTNEHFTIQINAGNKVITQYDSEHTTVVETSVNGITGYFIKPSNDEIIEIIWTDTINIYSVYGNISETDLLAIAENISYKGDH